MTISYFVERIDKGKELILKGTTNLGDDVFNVLQELLPNYKPIREEDLSDQLFEIFLNDVDSVYDTNSFVIDLDACRNNGTVVESYVRLREWYHYKKDGKIDDITHGAHGKDVEIVSNEMMEHLFNNPSERDDTKAYYTKVTWIVTPKQKDELVYNKLLPLIDTEGVLATMNAKTIRLVFWNDSDEENLLVPRNVLKALIDVYCSDCESEYDEHISKYVIKARNILENS